MPGGTLVPLAASQRGGIESSPPLRGNRENSSVLLSSPGSPASDNGAGSSSQNGNLGSTNTVVLDATKLLEVAEKARKKAKKCLRKLAVIEATLSSDEPLTDEKRNELLEAKHRLKMESQRLK